MQWADCKVLLVGVYYLLKVGISSLFHRQLRKMLNNYRNDISIEKVVVKLFVNFTWTHLRWSSFCGKYARNNFLTEHLQEPTCDRN